MRNFREVARLVLTAQCCRVCYANGQHTTSHNRVEHIQLRCMGYSAHSFLETHPSYRWSRSPGVCITLAQRGGASSAQPLATRAPLSVLPNQQSTSSFASPWSRTSATGIDASDRSSSQSRADTKDVLDAFLTRDSRNSFVARVYAILSVQLIVTAASVILFGTHSGWSRWMRNSGGPGAMVPFASLLLSTACWFVMCSSASARRQAPLKWQLLALFTLGEAVSVGFISSFYKFRSVVSAMLASAVAATSVSVYTATQKNPKYDLSQWGAGLSSCGLIFVVYGLIQVLSMVGILPQGLLPYHETLYGLLGACLFSFYLAYHTKLIVAGKHTKFQMNEKDYVFGAMTLYNDIVNLFIYTLRLIGEDRDD